MCTITGIFHFMCGRYINPNLEKQWYQRRVRGNNAEKGEGLGLSTTAYDLLSSLITWNVVSWYNIGNTKTGIHFHEQFLNSFKKLDSYVNAVWGIVYSLQEPTYVADLHLSSFGIFVLRQVMQIATGEERSTLDRYVTTVAQAVDNQLNIQVSEYKETNQTFDLDLLAFLHLYMGPSWMGPSVLSMSLLLNNIPKLSEAGKAALSLASFFLSRESLDPRDAYKWKQQAQEILFLLEDGIRVQGRTAYLVVGGNEGGPDFLATSIMLSVATFLQQEPLMPPTEQGTIPPVLVEKLANFVAQDTDVYSFGFRWVGGEEMVHNMLALGRYDQLKGNTSPSLVLRVNSRNETVLLARFDSPEQLAIKRDIPFDKLSNAREITFNATGTGEVSLVFGATFVPKEISLVGVYQGLTVNKAVKLWDPVLNSATGSSLNSSHVGQQVQVLIEIIIPDYVKRVDIVDPLPGCYEAIHEQFSQTFGPEISISQFRSEFRWDKVIFHGSWLWPGSHVVSYLAIMTTEGEFVLPPTKAFDPTQPEVMGLSTGGVTFLSSLTSSSTFNHFRRHSSSGETCLPLVKGDGLV
eukprot:TRINITY_DN27333_c0_g1_i1.p1 TRINITY_DN27333_c0_g1~~TRINITY_DN27333_c0_g1_i1.p1  ORF type:complete len:577 (+),score=144.65 TRINITY_DN27333_c0_g1_i1:15-1745(+)